jgi:hypothetical protein
MFSITVPLFVTVTVFCPLVTPSTVLGNVNDVGDSVTAGLPPELTHPGKLKLPIAVLQLKPPFCPVAFIYSSVYQNVQSSVGSTVIEV